MEAVVLRVANLRSGPGLTYEIVGKAQPGEVLTIVGATPAQDWYLLADGCWIAAFLVQPNSPVSPTAPPTAGTFLPTVQVRASDRSHDCGLAGLSGDGRDPARRPGRRSHRGD